MIDRLIYKFCAFVDCYTNWINKIIFESKPKKKKKK